MNCRTFRKNMEDYLEGGLDFPGRFGMERHAQQCICCGKEVSDAQKLRTIVRELQRVTSPPNFEAAVLSRIHAESKRNRFWNFKQYWIYGFDLPSRRLLAFGASGLAVLAGLGFFISYRFMQNSTPTATPAVVISKPVAGTMPQANTSLQSNAVPNKSAPVAKSFRKREAAPLALIPRHSEDAYSAASNTTPIYAEPADQDVVGLPVPGPDSTQRIMLLPKALKVRNEPPSEEYFIRNVSH
jgi:hypothetical protein